MIINMPGAYHAGFSNGWNIGEAVNLATPDWLGDIEVHKAINKKENYVKKSCFSVEWLLCQAMENLDFMKFSEEGEAKLISNY